MSCECVISNDSGEYMEEICDEIRTARKPHQCFECREMIQPGQRYEFFAGKFDGAFLTYHTCKLCVEVRTFFSCDGGWTYGQVWEDLMNHLFDHFHYGCLEPGDEDREPLSAAAKSKVVDSWRKWKGLAA